MQFKLSSVVALLLLLLTGDALACYKSGKTFDDLGNDDEVNLALTGLCQKLAGSYALHTQVRRQKRHKNLKLRHVGNISNP